MKDIIHQSSALPALSCGAAEATGRKQWLRFSPAGLWKALLLLLVLCIELPVFAQNIQVTGNVHDETGEPIIGASVIVVGATTGTATDFDGNFVLNNVPANGKLKVTYIGYNPAEVSVKGQTNVDVTLVEDSQVLDEVVVVGYGTMKKSDLTGSVSSVGTEKLNAKGAPSVLEALQGSTPGVNITKNTGRTNGGLSIEIRGKSSLNSSTTPLFVVDGVICGDIDFLNPQDIERIDVLKDASSTAIYGSRASAGVVMVTTKGGANVNKSQKATITYDGYYGFNKAARLPEFSDGNQYYRQRVMKLQEKEVYGGAQPYFGFANRTVFGQALIQQQQSDFDSPMLLKEMLANGETYDWPGLVIKDGHQQNHYLAISGSSDTANYHFGIGVNEEEGIYRGDDSKTYTFKGSVDARVNKVISGGFNFNLAYMENSYADDGGIADAYRANPFNIPYDEDGRIIEKPGSSSALGADANQFTDQVSPLLKLLNSNQRRKTYRALGNIYLQFDIIKGLNIKTTFSPSYTNYRHGYFAGYENPDKPGFTYAGTDMSTEGHNSADVENKTSLAWTWDNTVNFSRTFNEIHSVNFLGLISLEKGNTESSKITAIDVMQNTDWWNLGNSGVIQQVNSDNKVVTSTGYSESSMLSYALRGNYAFKDRYMVTATVRWDGSSKFQKGYRWGTFPSVALAWRLSEESFLQKEWLNNLKLRLSYGVSGNNTGIGNYETTVGIGSPIYYPFGPDYWTGKFPGSIVDANLHWEKSYEYNAGVDFGFLQNRINGSIDIYQKNSKELLYGVNLPLEAGGGNLKTNIGRVQNRGIEIALTTVNITNRDWEWTTTFAFSHNSNKVKEINGVSDELINGATGSLFVGKSISTLYGHEWGGIVTDQMMTVPDHEIAVSKGYTPGQPVRMCDYYYDVYGLQEGNVYIVDQNGDGTITDEDKVTFNGEPKWTGSVTSNLSYRLPKNGGMLDFSFNIYAKQGFKVYSAFMNNDLFRHDQRARNSIACDFYIPKGALVDADGMREDGTYINPVYMTQTHYGEWASMGGSSNMGAGNQMSQWNDARKFVDGSFVKVKNITLGYTFSKNILKHIACQNLRLYFTVTNPFVWTKYKGFDPEWADAAGKNDGPSIISYQIGASIKF